MTHSLFDSLPLAAAAADPASRATCSSCGVVKELSVFNKDKRKPRGYGSICLACKRLGKSLRLASRRGSLTKRFLAKVDRSDSDGCWLWIGTKNGSGYGRLFVRGKRADFAHRISYELHFGPIPEKMQVCHRCDNPLCVRPDHLFIGTQSDNIRDAADKERLYNMLPKEHVVAIRQLCASGIKQRDVAKQFGVSQSTVWRIFHRLARAGIKDGLL